MEEAWSSHFAQSYQCYIYLVFLTTVWECRQNMNQQHEKNPRCLELVCQTMIAFLKLLSWDLFWTLLNNLLYNVSLYVFCYNEGQHIDTKCLVRHGSDKKYLYTLLSISTSCYHRVIKAGRDFQYHLLKLYTILVNFPIYVSNKTN